MTETSNLIHKAQMMKYCKSSHAHSQPELVDVAASLYGQPFQSIVVWSHTNENDKYQIRRCRMRDKCVLSPRALGCLYTCIDYKGRSIHSVVMVLIIIFEQQYSRNIVAVSVLSELG